MPVAFDSVVEKITDAARRVDADDGASPVLVAVVREFQAKLAKAEKHMIGDAPVTMPSSSWNRPATAPRPRPKPTPDCPAIRVSPCSPLIWRSAC